MNSIKQLCLLAFFTTLLIPHSVYGQDKRDIADSLTVRLQPAEFDTLPQNIIQYLEENNYSIPQCDCKSEPHNIISGSFGKGHHTDWAVLASKNRISRILVFWEGSTNDISSIDKKADRIYLQAVFDEIIFSRRIAIADKNAILGVNENWVAPKPPSPIDHMGIEDIFVYKASTIHYYHDGQWMEFPRSD